MLPSTAWTTRNFRLFHQFWKKFCPTADLFKFSVELNGKRLDPRDRLRWPIMRYSIERSMFGAYAQANHFPQVASPNRHSEHNEVTKGLIFDKKTWVLGSCYFPSPKVPVGWCYLRKFIGLGICPEHRSFDRVLHYGSSESIPGVQPFAIELLRDFSVFQVDLYIRRNFSPKCEKSWKSLIFHVGFAHPEVVQGVDKLSRSAKGITEHF